jgi:GT2 family glycosyltransferase
LTSTSRAPLRLSVIIPIWNKARFIDRCLTSVLDAAHRASEVEILLVENGSTDGTPKLLHRYEEQGARILDCRAPTAGQVRNIGAENASGEILCFLDADVVVGPGYLSVVRHLFARQCIGATGRTVELPMGNWIERVWGQLHAQRHWRTNTLLNGASLCVRREIFRRVGGFHPTLPTGEDHDLCLRLIEAGATVVESPDLEVTHLDNPTSTRAFFAKERWRGLGALATARWNRFDKPLLLTMVYLASMVAAFGILVGSRASPGGVISAFTITLFAPVLAVAYRWTQADTPVGLLPAVYLYHLYFLARTTAFFDLIVGRLRASVSRRQ